ncbi:hypothetical protein HYC85_015260 [Camellia sinensis]|uniref:Uncharacterized protein n=1 Tax=Camellia sinensis TaxID=4442 RepID=A0A7J7GW73_CAMSI|nr:hypothetical protein HYC85_015260 [Camellia sinensis]
MVGYSKDNKPSNDKVAEVMSEINGEAKQSLQSPCSSPTLPCPRPHQPNAPILQAFSHQRCQGHSANTVCISKSMLVDLNSSTMDIDTTSDGYDEGGYDQAESPEAYLARLHDVRSRTLADLIKKLDGLGRPVDAIVYDGFLPWALDVAKEFGILGVVFFTQTCAVNSIYYHVHKGLLPLPLSPGSTVLLPGLLPLEPWETPSFVYIYGSFPAFYDLVVNQFSNIDQTDWVLFNTFYKLEAEVVDWMAKLWRVRTIGPTVPSMYLDELLKDDTDYGINLFKPKSSVCMNWLSDKPISSVVSLGTALVLYINRNGGFLERMKGTGVDVIGLDWTVGYGRWKETFGKWN